MSQELEYLSQQVAHGRSSRREFLGRAAALGVSAAAANALLSSAAHAAGPRRGGTMKVGMQGGAATDSERTARESPVDHRSCRGRQARVVRKLAAPRSRAKSRSR